MGNTIKSMSKNAAIIFFFSIFTLLSFIVFLTQNLLHPSLILDGLLIPDVISLSNSIDWIIRDKIEIASIPYSYVGVVILYISAWVIHPALSLIINLIMIFFCIWLVHDIFVKIGGSSGKLACLGVLCNPYIYLAVTGPNKEIPLLLITLLIFYLLLFKIRFWFPVSLILSITAIFFRDGYGFLLLAMIFFFTVFSKFPRRLLFFWLLLVSIGAAFFLQLSEFTPALERNLYVADKIVSSIKSAGFTAKSLEVIDNPFLSTAMFYLRILGNTISLSIRPQFFSVNGGLYLLGVAFWFFGILIFIGIRACLLVIFSKKDNLPNLLARQKISVLVIFLLIGMSVSLYIQPRYLMPLLPLSFGIFVTSKIRKQKPIFTSVFLIIVIVIIFHFMGFVPPLSQGSDEVPSFLL